jgi:cellulose synthase/poly-beta-1,6-N-acetylglucosamine synthase-like glycosyltransferase
MLRYIFDKLDCTYVLPGFAAFRKKALLDAGGFAADTLSEDCDIGLKMRKVGWRMVMSDAVIYTNVPQSISGVAKQRMRWGRGTVQVLKKHRDMIFNPKYGFIGLYGMPNQIYFFLQGFIILPITIYQIFSPYYTWYVSYGNYLSLEVLKYFLTWVSAYGTINYVHNTLTGVWPMTSSFPWFLASYVIIQTYDLIAIARISKMKIRLLFVLFFFFPYYLFTLLFFIVSIFLELNPFSKVRGHMNIWEKNR